QVAEGASLAQSHPTLARGAVPGPAVYCFFQIADPFVHLANGGAMLLQFARHVEERQQPFGQVFQMVRRRAKSASLLQQCSSGLVDGVRDGGALRRARAEFVASSS